MPTARKLPSGSWRCLAYDYTDEFGKRHYESFTSDNPCREGKLEAENKANEFLANKKNNPKKKYKMTLGEAIDEYISLSENVLSPTTTHRYRVIRRNSFQSLMNIQMNRLTSDDIQNAINNELKRKANNKNATISPNTVRNDYGLISAALSHFLPNSNFNIKLPTKEKKIKVLNEPKDIVAAVKGTDIELPCMIAMWLSFSLSEIKGLKWSSIHENKIQIDQVMVRVNSKDIEKVNAKNNQRKRVHQIPTYIQNLLNNTTHDSEYIVSMTGAVIYKRFTSVINNAGLHPMTFHDLRHVNASVMAILNIPDKYAQERGGWKSDKVMKEVYTQTFSSGRIEVDKKINTYFSELVYPSKENSEYIKKYNAWLILFEKEDNEDSRSDFEKFMQHEMQHKQ